MTLTIKNLIKIVSKWYNYNITEDQAREIKSFVNDNVEDVDCISEAELCWCIGEVVPEVL